ncbi:hypothetical protein [Roseibium marinum]|uniref:Uncharacterized protein n=1 Tax=Roseibium marinum TaxID=281252 RepID=A0A2S3UPX5_9HYPH|nr:hypothetical protein [Roseibium marinum]POF29593.1 hypothetical protein CLV41_10816 [Roseibium marinum]
MKGTDWKWRPGVSVGPVKFGVSLQDYQADFDVALIEPEGTDATGWGEYEFGGEDKTVWTEEGKIVGVRCDDFFGYKGKNLIGMSEAEFIEHMGRDPDEIGTSVEYEDGSIQTPFEYEDLALEVWSEDGKIVCASATEIVND